MQVILVWKTVHRGRSCSIAMILVQFRHAFICQIFQIIMFFSIKLCIFKSFLLFPCQIGKNSFLAYEIYFLSKLKLWIVLSKFDYFFQLNTRLTDENLINRFSLLVIFLKGGPHFRAPCMFINKQDKSYGSKVTAS